MLATGKESEKTFPGGGWSSFLSSCLLRTKYWAAMASQLAFGHLEVSD
jgi:hypothetical protein